MAKKQKKEAHHKTATETAASNASSKKKDSATVSKKKNVKRPGTKFGAKKGKQFEREIATALGHIFPDAQRMLEYQGSNVIGVDLENTDIFRFQCKCTANYKNPNSIFEIRETEPHVPVLVTKANNRPPMAVLPFTEFVTLLEMAYGHRERLINPYMGLDQQKAAARNALAGAAKLPPIEVEYNGKKLEDVEVLLSEDGRHFRVAVLPPVPSVEFSLINKPKPLEQMQESDFVSLSSFL